MRWESPLIAMKGTVVKPLGRRAQLSLERRMTVARLAALKRGVAQTAPSS